jgi:DNA topoisomerase-1
VARRLVIVESLAKARTLERYLNEDDEVRVCGLPVRGLPQGRLGVDVDRGFAVDYETTPRQRRAVAGLRAAAREAEQILLAGAPDREGELQSWHLATELASSCGLGARVARLRLPEITPEAVEAALRRPQPLDSRQVAAAQARLVLDRLTENALGRPLSAGRVAVAALCLVCRREREPFAGPGAEVHIRAHLDAGDGRRLTASLLEIHGPPDRRGADVARILGDVGRAAFRVLDARDEQRRLAPPAPFVTATLLEDAFRRLRFSAGRTMRLARRLYDGVPVGDEGPVGLITNATTGSPHVEPRAAGRARRVASRLFGRESLGEQGSAPSRDRADPLEGGAIRPTDPERTPESLAPWLQKDELALYTLVWSRFLASHMKPAVHDVHVVEVGAFATSATASAPTHRLRVESPTCRAPGFSAVYPETPEDATRTGPGTPASSAGVRLEPGAELSLVRLDPGSPPGNRTPPFTEATLIAGLDRLGIGRPASFAAVLPSLVSAGLVRVRAGRIESTGHGRRVFDLVEAHLPVLADPLSVAALEASLDDIGEGRDSELNVLLGFHRRLEAAGLRGRAAMAAREREARPASGEPVPGTCPDCGAALSRRQGRYGPLVGCSRFPACRYLQRKEVKAVGIACPACHTGQVVERAGRSERRFFGCSRYPACHFTSPHRPLAEGCPVCGWPYLLERTNRRLGRLVVCGSGSCAYRRAE